MSQRMEPERPGSTGPAPLARIEELEKEERKLLGGDVQAGSQGTGEVRTSKTARGRGAGRSSQNKGLERGECKVWSGWRCSGPAGTRELEEAPQGGCDWHSHRREPEHAGFFWELWGPEKCPECFSKMTSSLTCF